MKKEKDRQEVIQEVTKKLLSMLGVVSSFTIQISDELIEISLEGADENGILIGYHGETLEALQLIASLCIAKEIGTFQRVSIEIGEYKKNRMDYLQNIVGQTKERVLSEQKGISLPDLKSWERRYVHMLLANDAEVMTESSGEGRERTLTIYPKQ